MDAAIRTEELLPGDPLDGYNPADYPEGWENDPSYNQPPREYVEEAEGLIPVGAPWSEIYYVAFRLKAAYERAEGE